MFLPDNIYKQIYDIIMYFSVTLEKWRSDKVTCTVHCVSSCVREKVTFTVTVLRLNTNLHITTYNGI